MNHIEIFYKKEDFDVVSKAKLKNIAAAGFQTNFVFKTEYVYKFEGINEPLENAEVDSIAKEILLDPVIQEYKVDSLESDDRYAGFYIADIWLKNGVTDPVGESISRGIKTIGIKKPVEIHSGFRYLLAKEISENLAKTIVEKILMNSVIQEYIFR